MIEAKWLFQNYKSHVSRIQVLEYLLKETKFCDEKDNSIIDTLTFHRSSTAAHRPRGYNNSRTESIALHLDEIRHEHAKETSAIYSEWQNELLQMNLYVYLHDAAFNALTDEERTLVQLHYERRYTIDEITQMPLTDGTAGLKSKSTLCRMLRTIENKSQQIVNVSSPQDRAGAPLRLSILCE